LLIMASIYKICTEALWRQARDAGVFTGAPVDEHDGFIHFSTAAQLGETARKHFSGVGNLVLLAVDTAILSEGCAPLRWEPSRGGDLFPHLYAPLPVSAVKNVTAVPLAEDGAPIIPYGLAP
jgi:uncharacterized protein (DUF952 family)